MRDGGPPEEMLSAYLRSHHIDADELRADDFDALFAKRRAALLSLVQRVTGFGFARETPEPDPVDEEPDEADADDQMEAA